jgi:hypothetical protein
MDDHAGTWYFHSSRALLAESHGRIGFVVDHNIPVAVTGNIEAEVGRIDLVVERIVLVAAGDHIDPVVDHHTELALLVDRTEFLVDRHIYPEGVVDRIEPATDHTDCSRTNNDLAVAGFQVDFHK